MNLFYGKKKKSQSVVMARDSFLNIKYDACLICIFFNEDFKVSNC